MDSPCKGCTERVLYCHSSCSKYAAFRQALDVANAKAAAERAETDFLCEVKRAIINESLRKRKAGAIKYGKIT